MRISTVFTIGHSNQPAAEFLGLLEAQDVELVVDVRSKPYSRFRHFNREALEDRLDGMRILYSHRGKELGGHPPQDKFYNEHGRVAYERLATLRTFRRAISKIVEESEQSTLALMCTEEDPAEVPSPSALGCGTARTWPASSPHTAQEVQLKTLGE